jgi:hypothetical protein
MARGTARALGCLSQSLIIFLYLPYLPLMAPPSSLLERKETARIVDLDC